MHTRVLVPEEVAENVNIWPSYLKLRRGHLTEDRKEEKTILHTFLHTANIDFLCTIELDQKKQKNPKLYRQTNTGLKITIHLLTLGYTFIKSLHEIWEFSWEISCLEETTIHQLLYITACLLEIKLQEKKFLYIKTMKIK